MSDWERHVRLAHESARVGNQGGFRQFAVLSQVVPEAKSWLGEWFADRDPFRAEFVYLIGEDGGEFFKIGVSEQPRKRVSQVRTDERNLDLKLLHCFLCRHAWAVETFLHRMFKDKHVPPGREWFELSPEDVALIKSIGPINGVDGLKSQISNSDLLDHLGLRK